MNVVNTTQATAQIVAVNAPILLLDTCSLLDLMRDPTREKFGAERAAAAIKILSAAEANPQRLSVIIAKQVDVELKEHMDATEAECKRAVTTLATTFKRVIDIASAYGLTVPPSPDLLAISLPAAARSVVDRLMAASQCIQEEDIFVLQGWQRVTKGIAPATRGKNSAKDCVITETYLGLANEIRNACFTEKILFLSSNTADYTQGQRPKLHSDLQADFRQAGIEFQYDLLAVRYALNI